jgi:hypothetical protein
MVPVLQFPVVMPPPSTQACRSGPPLALLAVKSLAWGG